jgi:hypothetical protein
MESQLLARLNDCLAARAGSAWILAAHQFFADPGQYRCSGLEVSHGECRDTGPGPVQTIANVVVEWHLVERYLAATRKGYGKVEVASNAAGSVKAGIELVAQVGLVP